MYSNNLINHSMKTKFFKSLLAIACLLSSMNVLAQESSFVVDGIFYNGEFGDTICMVKYGEKPYTKEDITIPETVVYNNKKITVIGIDNSSFADCDNLKKVTIPNTVIIIGKRAFQNCSSLTNVTIPNSVIGIGHHAFENCTGLTTLYSLNPIPPEMQDKNCFDNEHYETLKVFVPRSALAKYKQAEGWKNFKKLQAFDPK